MSGSRPLGRASRRPCIGRIAYRRLAPLGTHGVEPLQSGPISTVRSEHGEEDPLGVLQVPLLQVEATEDRTHRCRADRRGRVAFLGSASLTILGAHYTGTDRVATAESVPKSFDTVRTTV